MHNQSNTLFRQTENQTKLQKAVILHMLTFLMKTYFHKYNKHLL